MNCVNCGRENPEKALICYWCGLDPDTGEQPYQALAVPAVTAGGTVDVPDVALPPEIEVPAPKPVPEVQTGMDTFDQTALTMPDLPTIEIAPPPELPDEAQFSIVRRRARHRPVVRATPIRSLATRPVLPGLGRILVFIGGLGLLFVLGSALVAAVGAASFGSAFCLLGLLGLGALLWMGLLLARTGKRIVERAGVVYERLDVLGRVLREVAPGVVQELPVNLPKKMGVLDLPVAYSELRSLAGQEGEPPLELAVDLLTGAIADLIGRDDVVLARRTYPVESRGILTRSASTQITRPVLTRRRVYVGPGDLEERIARILRTEKPMTVEELVRALVGPDGRRGAQEVVTWVNEALTENPPDLEALASTDDALAEVGRFRDAMREADPELYDLLQSEIRRGLGAMVQRSVPSSLLDLARSSATIGEPSRQVRRRPDSQRRG
jgi:hypothetical protein